MFCVSIRFLFVRVNNVSKRLVSEESMTDVETEAAETTTGKTSTTMDTIEVPVISEPVSTKKKKKKTNKNKNKKNNKQNNQQQWTQCLRKLKKWPQIFMQVSSHVIRHSQTCCVWLDIVTVDFFVADQGYRDRRGDRSRYGKQYGVCIFDFGTFAFELWSPPPRPPSGVP